MNTSRISPSKYMGSNHLSPKKITERNRQAKVVSWLELIALDDEIQVREILCSSLVKFFTLPNSTIVRWTMGILDDVQQRFQDEENFNRSVMRRRMLINECHIHEIMAKAMIHSYALEVYAVERQRVALNNLELEKVKQLSNKTKDGSIQLYPYYATEIVINLIGQGPEEEVNENIRRLVDKFSLLDTVLNGIRYGIFTFKFCCLRLLKLLLMKSEYVRELMQDTAYRDIYVPALIGVMKSDGSMLLNELKSSRGLHQSQILSPNNSITNSQSIRLVGILAETSSLLLFNIMILNSDRRAEILAAPSIIEEIVNLSGKFPHEGYPESEIQLSSCNILYFLCGCAKAEKEEDIIEYRQLIGPLASNHSTLRKIVYILQTMKSVIDLPSWVNRRILKSEYRGTTIEQLSSQLANNFRRAEIALLNVIADISTIPEIASELLSIQNRMITTLLRLRKSGPVAKDLRMFLFYRDVDQCIAIVQPNDYSALSIAMKNLYLQSNLSNFPEILEFLIDSCSFVKQKALHCLKMQEYEVCHKLLTICLRILWKTEGFQSKDLENLRISIYETRSETNKAWGDQEAAKIDSLYAFHYRSVQVERMCKKIERYTSLEESLQERKFLINEEKREREIECEEWNDQQRIESQEDIIPPSEEAQNFQEVILKGVFEPPTNSSEHGLDDNKNPSDKAEEEWRVNCVSIQQEEQQLEIQPEEAPNKEMDHCISLVELVPQSHDENIIEGSIVDDERPEEEDPLAVAMRKWAELQAIEEQEEQASKISNALSSDTP